MYSFTNLLAVLVSASAVLALPQILPGLGESGDGANNNGSSTGDNSTCTKGSRVSCCDTKGGDGLLGNILGGACDIPDLTIIAVSADQQCPTGNAFCCPTTQTGNLDVNLACIPITV